MYRLLTTAIAALAISTSAAAMDRSDPRAVEALSLYRDIVGLRSAAGHGKVPDVARRIAADLKAAGFAETDISIVAMGETAYLLARYAGKKGTKARPVAFLGHMDVVGADTTKWETDAFTPTIGQATATWRWMPTAG